MSCSGTTHFGRPRSRTEKARLDFGKDGCIIHDTFKRRNSRRKPSEDKDKFYTLATVQSREGRRDVEETASIGVRGQLSLHRSSPAAEVKGFRRCQAKGPELVISETKHRSNIFARSRKIPASTRRVSKGSQGACNNILKTVLLVRDSLMPCRIVKTSKMMVTCRTLKPSAG